jgi:alpha-L-fucosidase
MAWWRDARFGMFIHWGIYSVPARGEWYMNNGKVPVNEYERYAGQFNPTKFDALSWVKLAKTAGMKYIVITSKHHDGFCMWDSKVSDYDIIDRTPFKRDVLKELSAACAREGIRLCFYHSIMDWHHLDARGDRFPEYRENYLKPQLKELLTGYGPIGVLWFDGEWIGEWTEQEGKDLYRYVRSLQPEIIVNNRVGKGRNGLEGMNSDTTAAGDYGTPEQEIPATGLPGVDWESCMTMNDNWGFRATDTNWKSTEDLIHNLVDIASKGGNYLLNVGPTAEGLIPTESVKRLEEVGAWMKVNGESIYGTMASPFPATPWGCCTMKRLPNGGSRVFLHVFPEHQRKPVVITGLGAVPTRAVLLARPALPLALVCSADSATVHLPEFITTTSDCVVALDFPGELIVYLPPVISAQQTIFTSSLTVPISSANPSFDIRYTLDGTDPSDHSPAYHGPIPLAGTTTIRARSFHKSRGVSTISEVHFERVVANSAVAAHEQAPGLVYEYFEGTIDSVSDLDRLPLVRSGNVAEIGLGMEHRKEFYALRVRGYIAVDSTDVYNFGLTSDDGSRLWVDGKLVADNDGLHGAKQVQGMIALARGEHAIAIEYFNKTGDAELRVSTAIGTTPLKPVTADHLTHSAAESR